MSDKVYYWSYDPLYGDKLGLLRTINASMACHELNVFDIEIGIDHDDITDGIIKIKHDDSSEVDTWYVVNKQLVIEEEYEKHQLIKQLAGIK